MKYKHVAAVLKGFFVAIFLSAINVAGFTPEWWIAAVSLTAAVNLQ